MTKEKKQLLLKDICARLPYELIIYISARGRYKPLCRKQKFIDFGYHYNCKGKKDPMANGYMLEHIKPYLRPMSSMTKDEEEELKQVALVDNEGVPGDIPAYIDWLNKKMFDYRGLIPMGLALEAPEGMYNITK